MNSNGKHTTSLSPKERRRKALMWWLIVLVAWAFYAITDSIPERMPPPAGDDSIPFITSHLRAESGNMFTSSSTTLPLTRHEVSSGE
ncbi:MAG: hypothetical protein ABFD54_17850 [Armatimonadota bacterium]